jgi:hypothetical protein
MLKAGLELSFKKIAFFLLAIMSSHMITWSPKDLTIFWPLYDLPKSLPAIYRTRTFIGTRDEFNGLEVTEQRKHESIIRSIPDHYGNPLSVINSRIMHLQACDAYLKGLGDEPQEILERLKDSCRRNLTFTCTVRQQFYEEVASAFYGNSGAPSRKFFQQDSSFRK